jgi:hypothetical protein
MNYIVAAVLDINFKGVVMPPGAQDAARYFMGQMEAKNA